MGASHQSRVTALPLAMVKDIGRVLLAGRPVGDNDSRHGAEGAQRFRALEA